ATSPLRQPPTTRRRPRGVFTPLPAGGSICPKRRCYTAPRGYTARQGYTARSPPQTAGTAAPSGKLLGTRRGARAAALVAAASDPHRARFPLHHVLLRPAVAVARLPSASA